MELKQNSTSEQYTTSGIWKENLERRLSAIYTKIISCKMINPTMISLQHCSLPFKIKS
jgi:hypothetical protein